MEHHQGSTDGQGSFGQPELRRFRRSIRNLDKGILDNLELAVLKSKLWFRVLLILMQQQSQGPPFPDMLGFLMLSLDLYPLDTSWNGHKQTRT